MTAKSENCKENTALPVYRFFGIYRLVLALLVALHHFAANAAPLELTYALQPLEPGSLAVLAFFALSGYVIAEAADVFYQRKPAAFLINRLLRVYPHFIVALTFSIALHYYFIVHTATFQATRGNIMPGTEIFEIKNLLMNYFSILPAADKFSSFRFIPITWAIKVEMVFYIAIWLCLTVNTFPSAGKNRGLGFISTVLFILCLPLFIFSVMGRLPAFLTFIPYFSYGAGLYFCQKGKKAGLLVMLTSLPLMLWQFLSLPPVHPDLGFERNIPAQLALLATLIAVTTWLAKCRFQKFEHLDKQAGVLTYPLYIYHYLVMIIVTGIFTDFSYGLFFMGMGLSVLAAYLFSRLIDPFVDRLRNHLRGQKLN